MPAAPAPHTCPWHARPPPPREIDQIALCYNCLLFHNTTHTAPQHTGKSPEGAARVTRSKRAAAGDEEQSEATAPHRITQSKSRKRYEVNVCVVVSKAGGMLVGGVCVAQIQVDTVLTPTVLTPTLPPNPHPQSAPRPKKMAAVHTPRRHNTPAAFTLALILLAASLASAWRLPTTSSPSSRSSSRIAPTRPQQQQQQQQPHGQLLVGRAGQRTRRFIWPTPEEEEEMEWPRPLEREAEELRKRDPSLGVCVFVE
jgi:hypothetical protein